MSPMGTTGGAFRSSGYVLVNVLLGCIRLRFGYARPAWGQPVLRLFSSYVRRGSNYVILVSITAPRPLRPAGSPARR